MDWGIVLLSALLGGAAGAAMGYWQNWIAGWAVLGLGAVAIFGASGGGGPGGTVENFFDTVGPIAGSAMVIGAVVGFVAGHSMRTTGEQSGS